MAKSHKKYLTEIVLPKAAAEGTFGPGLSFVKSDLDKSSSGVDQFASSVVFLTAIVAPSGGGPSNERRLVVKFQPPDVNVRSLMNSDVQFHNERIMYSEILPMLNSEANEVSSIFPKFYYGAATLGVDPDSDVIVLQDLKEEQFKLTEERAFLDYDHLSLALKALGKFHALSYIAKQKKPKEFEACKSKLKEHVWDRVDNSSITDKVMNVCSLRGVKPLCEEYSDNEILARMKRTFESSDMRLFMKELVRPEEPTAVICHGDFLRNNLLFSYDDSTGRPKAVRFFDLQTSRYASPVIDLSLIMWINTTYEFRAKHWHDLLKVYHDSVVETTTEAGCSAPSFQQLEDDLRKKGVYGYMHSSYFLPMMVSEEPPDIENASSLSPEEMGVFLSQVSGELGTKVVSDIVRHLIEFKYFP